jgi:hypothetical protein
LDGNVLLNEDKVTLLHRPGDCARVVDYLKLEFLI